jgi:acetyl-CoA synthetase (ADP-forming)
MKILTEYEAKILLKKYSIPVTKEYLAKTEEEAVEYAKKIGYPVVLKVMSPQIIHKTEAGCVLINVKNRNDVKKGFRKILENAKKYRSDAEIKGVLVQEMVKGADVREVIVGSKMDEQFGPVIMFGVGGIFVEVIKDISFRIIPIERKDAVQMIKEIKAYKILEGVRGQKPINFQALEDCLMNVSKMVWEEKNIRELDINPLFVDEKNIKAGDARIVVEEVSK